MRASSVALWGGTSVPDASSVGVVLIEYIENDTIPVGSGCSFGTGVLLTNDMVLTAGHVADWPLNLAACAISSRTPQFMRITMPDPSLPSARQLALISCGGNTKEGCGAKFHAAYVTPTLDPSGNASGNDRGQDAAMIPLLTGFVVNGLGVDYLRHLTNQPSASFYHTKATCYGMSENAPNATSTVGQLTKFDFTILAFPPPDPTRPASGPSVPELFSVVRGGGETPTLGQYVNGVLQAIPVKGDSGGPCIVHTSGVDGDVIGILHGGPRKIIGSIYEPSSADYSAAQGFRDFAQSVLGVHGPRVVADLDGGGVADDAIEMRASTDKIPPAEQTIVVAVSFDNGATELTQDTFIPLSFAPYAGSFTGDFDANGTSDILTTIGDFSTAISGYFNGAPASSFSFTDVPTWQPNGPYQFYTVGRFNGDGVDDVAAVHFDGTEDVFLGEPNVGLTVPAQFVPRGLDFFGLAQFSPSPPQETMVVAAPGTIIADITTGNLVKQAGTVYILADQGLAAVGRPGLHVGDLFLNPDVLTCLPSAARGGPGDLFGSALAWGSFDGDTTKQALVITAPGLTVTGASNAGGVLYFKFDPNNPSACSDISVLLDESTMGGTVRDGAFLGRIAAAGDFNGDGKDDLAVTANGFLYVLTGVDGSGISTSSPKQSITSAQLGFASPFLSMTSGDFNCDGFEDLAVSAAETVAGAEDAGQVLVLYGAASGLDPRLSQRLDESTDGIATDPFLTDFFGIALAAGNFNGDAFDGRPCVDLAVGAEEFQSLKSGGAGAVHVIFGSPDGLRAVGSQYLTQGGAAADGTTIPDTRESFDVFGDRLSITRADTDRFDDLVIAVPGEDNNAGAAQILRGGANGVRGDGPIWRQGDGSGFPGTAQGAPNPGFQSGGHLGWGVGGTSNGMIVVGSSFYNWIDPNGVKPTVLQAGWAALVRVDDTSSINIFKQTAIDEPTLLMGAMDARQDAFLGQVIAQPRPAFVAQKDAPPRYSGELSLYSGVGFLPLACPSGDTTAPSITAIQATPSCIWPPNDKLVLYQLDNQIQVTVKDACDPFPKVRIVNVTSSQLDADQPDVFFGNRAACVRAERSDAPRIYTVTVEAKDFSGNTSFATTTVTVPQAKTRGCKLDSSSFVLDGDPRCSL